MVSNQHFMSKVQNWWSVVSSQGSDDQNSKPRVPTEGEIQNSIAGQQKSPIQNLKSKVGWLILGLATLGLILALKLPARLWQSIDAWWHFDFSLNGMQNRPNPFSDWASPFPTFPIFALTLWLAAAGMLKFQSSKSKIQDQNNLESIPLGADLVSVQGDHKARPYKKPTYWGKLLVLSPQSLVLKRSILTPISIILVIVLGFGVRAAQLLPNSAGQLPASNFDEMVYYSASNLLAAGNLPYKDFFLAHPPLTMLLFGTFFKLAALVNGGYNAFLAARWLCLIIGLATCLGIWWVSGRMWATTWQGRLLVGTLCGLVYATDVGASQVAVLEVTANLLAILALICWLQATLQPTRRKNWWLLATGVLAGLSGLAKLPGLALIFALLAYLLFKRDWQALWRVSLGFVISGGVVLGIFGGLAGMSEMTRQMLFFQLLRPQEVREGLDQIGRIASYPENGLTILLGGLAFVVIAWRMLRRNLSNDLWLVPALWSLPLLIILTAGKSFHPWYYVQWALPLSLLIGGLVSPQRHRDTENASPKAKSRIQESEARSQKPELEVEGQATNPQNNGQASRAFLRPSTGLASLIFIVALPLAVQQWQVAQTPDFDPVYKSVGEILATQTNMQVLTFDPGYAFMAGREPARLPNGKYLVDSAGYMVYLNLDVDRRGWFDLIKVGLAGSRARGQVDAIFRRERAQAAVVSALKPGQWAVLDGKIALPQLTPRSVEYIAGVSGTLIKQGYVTLYPVLANNLTLRDWRFDNGLILRPMGLSSSMDGRANFDPLLPDGNLQLTAQDVPRRTLDLRFIWRIENKSRAAQPVKVFIHLIDERGEKVAQRDIKPLDDQTDTTNWQAGDFFQDVHSLPLPALPPGRYRLETGLYQPDTLQPILVEGKASLILGYLIVV